MVLKTKVVVILAFPVFVVNRFVLYAGTAWEPKHALWHHTYAILQRYNLKD